MTLNRDSFYIIFCTSIRNTKVRDVKKLTKNSLFKLIQNYIKK